MGDIFLKIDGIAGESLDAQHPGEIEVLSFAWGVVNESGAGAGTGGGAAGRPTFRDFQVTSAVSKASPRLMLACANGTHFRSAVLSVRKAGGASQDYLRVTLKDCVVSAYQSATSEGGAPVDQVSLEFAKATYSYRPQKADGSLGSAVEVSVSPGG